MFYPVKLRSGSSTINPVLELFYFRGQYQLATRDALYSDGSRYRPLVAAFRMLRDDFKDIKKVLVLGTGLGSAAFVAQRMGFAPHFTFVDLDSTVLQWAEELMPPAIAANAGFICADAEEFIRQDADSYDLIVVDIFIGRAVPDQITGEEFLAACRRLIGARGRLVLNYMVAAPNGINPAKAALEALFGDVREIAFGLNRVYITGNSSV